MLVTWRLLGWFVFGAYAAAQTSDDRFSNIKIVSCLPALDENMVRNQSRSALVRNGLDGQYSVDVLIDKSTGVCSNLPWLASAKSTGEALIAIDRLDDDNRLAGIILRPSDVDLTTVRAPVMTTYDADERTATAAADFLDYFGWKSAVIFSSQDLKWKSLADQLELTLRRRFFAVKYPVQFVSRMSNEQIGNLLTSDVKAIFICGTMDATWSSFISVVNSTRFSIRQSAAMLTFQPITNGFIRSDPLSNMLEKLILFVISAVDQRAQLGALQKRDARQQGRMLDRIYESVALTGALLQRNISGVVSVVDTFAHDPPGDNATIEIQLANQQTAQFSLKETERHHWVVVRHVRPLLLQWLPAEKRYMNALQLETNGTDRIIVRTISPIRWPNIFVQAREFCDVTVDCYLSEPSGSSENAVMAIIVAVIIGTFLTATMVVVIRWRLQKNLAIRGPNKILFTTEDVVLPFKFSSDLIRPDLIRASNSSIITLGHSGNIRRVLPVASETANGTSTPAPRIKSPIMDSLARYNVINHRAVNQTTDYSASVRPFA